ncbi:uncharacterized protein DUF4157 [Litoreibacter ponti]|uniref:Uncharacterized protein DUF4157 n=1 Tax=Litoreibacter ponti TaxID=1510457 RepID=A0A2T6BJ73_9RHOB|nr:DUF4157 domain-containing protein [Litoreibacter ponti]PTX56113.1 uncharacterized protein DUF4157 [Litoreibacter ponti]
MKAKAHIQTKGSRGATTARATPVPVRRPMPQISAVARPALQTALKVGAVSDPAEREAETMAARVVGASAPAPVVANAPPAAPANSSAQPLRRDAESQPNLDELVPEPAPAAQQDFDLPKQNDVATDGLDAADMGELESGAPVDTGGAAGEEGALQAAATPAAKVGRMGGAAPSDVSRLVANPGPGRPLPSGLRARVEPHFGTSFEDVRLHDGPADQDAAARIGARAFTHKNRIWLGRGESPTNTRLMAHELSHVVQQTEGSEALPLRREPVLRREEDEGWAEGKLEGYARYVPGYTLITVIVGKTLISGKKVIKNATNLLGGLFGLHPLGTVLFDKLRETRMVEEAYQWVLTRLGELNLTWSRLQGTVAKIWDAPLVGAKQYVIDLFGPLVSDLVTFAKDVGKKVLEFAVRGALKLAGPYADKVWAIIQQAGDVLDLIIENPLAFAKNLIKAVVGGFMKFGANIFEHLKKGLLGWLFGAIAGAGITLPARFDFKGLMSLVMQILGLTYANFRAELVKKLGPSGERKVALIEKSVEIVKVLLKEGFTGIWQKMLEMIENFKQTLIGGISSMVITTVIKAGISWLAGLSNPVGAVVKVVLGIYDLIVAFLERLEQIMDVAQSIFSSVGAIARGQTEAAAKFVEQTIGRTVPVVISFLAAALGLGGISSKIKSVIEKLQAPVKKAMGKLIGFVIKKAKALFSKLIAKLNGKRKLPRKAFMIGKEPHEIYAVKKGNKIDVMIGCGEPGTVPEVTKATKAAAGKVEAPSAQAPMQNLIDQTKEVDDETDAEAKKIKPASEKENNQKKYKALDAEFAEAAGEFLEDGKAIAANPFVSEKPEGKSLLRGKEPRSLEFEGKVDTYNKLSDAAKDKDPETGQTFSRFHELDHTIEKRFPLGIFERLHFLKKGNRKKVPETDALRSSRQAAGAAAREGTAKDASVQDDAKAPGIGNLAKDKIKGGKIGATASGFPAIALYHRNHIKGKGKGLPDAAAIISAAQAELNKARGTEAKAVAVVKNALLTQVEAEVAEIRDIYAADTSAANVRAQVNTGLDTIRQKNIDFYGLQNASADMSAHTPPTQAPTDKSAIPFDTQRSDRKTPQPMISVEGIGKAYGTQPSGFGQVLEHDHVLDKSFAKKAATHKQLDEAEAATVETAAETKTARAPQPGHSAADRAARLGQLTNAALFGDGSPLRTYTDDLGYAVPIYRPIAKEVTARVQAPLDTVAQPVKLEDAENDAANYVAYGDTTARDALIQKKTQKIKRRLEDRTKNHAAAIKDFYLPQIDYVRSINETANRANAESQMRAIMKNLYVSLGEAQAETRKLFR